jgi:hypothetical protein
MERKSIKSIKSKKEPKKHILNKSQISFLENFFSGDIKKYTENDIDDIINKVNRNEINLYDINSLSLGKINNIQKKDNNIIISFNQKISYTVSIKKFLQILYLKETNGKIEMFILDTETIDDTKLPISLLQQPIRENFHTHLRTINLF